MLISAVLFLILANLVNHSVGFKQDVKTAFLGIACLWLILIFTFRGTSVPDTDTYIKIFNSHNRIISVEYLFNLLCQLTYFAGFSFNGFLFIYELVLFAIWFYTSKKYLEDIHLAFLVFLPFMGIYNFGIIIRAGMGLVLCYFAIIYLIQNRSFKGYLLYYLIVTLAFFFHQAMIVFYILPFFLFINFSTQFILLVLLFSATIPIINIQPLITKFFEVYVKLFSVNKFISYTELHANFSRHGEYSLTMIKYWLMAVLFLGLRPKVKVRRDIYNCFLNIYISGIILIFMTHYITAGNRLAYMFFFFEFALVGILYQYSELPKKIVFLGALALCILNYLNLISAIPTMITY